MQAVCRNCHGNTHVVNFYKQFDSLVVLYNEKFAAPALKLMKELKADGVLKPDAPFQKKVQWTFWELWHHEGRRARHGASMMGPGYTHWQGMYEVSKHFYFKFLPEVIEAAGEKSDELKEKYQRKVDELLAREEHIWIKGLTGEEAAVLRETYRRRYDK